MRWSPMAFICPKLFGQLLPTATEATLDPNDFELDLLLIFNRSPMTWSMNPAASNRLSGSFGCTSHKSNGKTLITFRVFAFVCLMHRLSHCLFKSGQVMTSFEVKFVSKILTFAFCLTLEAQPFNWFACWTRPCGSAPAWKIHESLALLD